MIIIGAGPAGLAAARVLSAATESRLLVDAGKGIAQRDHGAVDDITRGVGGAGMFSDGKFSFFPAATALWTLPDRDALHDAYATIADFLAEYGLEVPSFPENPPPRTALAPGRWVWKGYPSHYIDLARREQMTVALFAPNAHPDHHALQTRVVSIAPGEDHTTLQLQHGETGEVRRVTTRHLVLAGGRFMPLQWNESGFGLKKMGAFSGFEFGVRIQDAASAPFFAEMRGVDPKYRFVHPSEPMEWRTFCCCRNGEVVVSNTNGLFTASGRADCPPTGLSNIGFLNRILTPELAQEVATPILERARRERTLFTVNLHAALGASALLRDQLGPGADSLLEGLELLCDAFPSLRASSSAELLGPCVERGGVTLRNKDLRLEGTNIWVAGDCSGHFRGIVSSLISGQYVGLKVAKMLALG